MKRFIVERLEPGRPRIWLDVDRREAPDAGTALQQALSEPDHKIMATTYRVSEEALLVNVSINLEEVGKE